MNNWWAALSLTLLLTNTCHSQELTQLRPWLPEDFNAVAIVRPGKLLQSPQARAENSQPAHNDNMLGGVFVLPPDCSLYVRVTSFHPGRSENWSAALLEFTRKVDLKRIAEQEQARIQTVWSHLSVLSPRNCYFTVIDDNIMGVISPAVRQELARWLERGPKPDLLIRSSALRPVIDSSDSAITLAIDLTELFDPERIRHHLQTFEAVQGHQKDIDSLASQVQSLRLLRLDLNVANGLQSRLTMQFGMPISASPELLKNILIESLGHLGAGLDSLAGTKATLEDKSVILTGSFSEEDLRRVMTLITSPHPVSSPSPDEAVADAPPANNPVNARPPRVTDEQNIRYFKAVDQVLIDLQGSMRIAKNYNQTAIWHNNFANKIDQLSTVSVDPDLVKYGQFVSTQLRALSASLRGIGANLDTLNRSIVYNTSFNPGWEQIDWWGGYGYSPPTWRVDSNLAEVRQKQADLVIAGTNDRQLIWERLNAQRNEILGTLQSRYGNEFIKAIERPKR